MNPTTLVVIVKDHPDGQVVINEADFDPAIHTRAEPEPDPAPAEPEQTPAKPAKPGKTGK